jgi:enamine deaminase RidA (YjgF/YER057c/UK114 family)
VGLEAIKPKAGKAVKVQIVSSRMQCEAWKYGPKFSRAVLVTFKEDNIRKLYVSGTSSVNRRGKSVLKGKCGENIAYVMACIKHLLEKNRMSFDDLVMSHAYFKNAVVYEEFRSVYAANAWDFPYNPIFVDICRDDLLFEMECIAADKAVTEKLY